jgi:pimeloyl-ACP methyl ester carboxylesterase
VSVVCLHGLGRTPADWNGVRSGLERFGPVSAPRLPRDPAAALAVASAAVVPGDIVVGHSMGGVLALQLARERPPRALILTSCFFPPARNGRGVGATLTDYARHRVAFVRTARRGPSGGSARALASLARLAAQPERLRVELDAVLVIHARDDHHVPVDFALAAASRQGWAVTVLDHGGHHPHVEEPERWLAAAVAWLERQRTP